MSVNIQTLKDIRNYISEQLTAIYPESEISAITNLIIKTSIGVDRLHALIDPEQIVSPADADRVTEICNELRIGKPLQYILGETLFYDCVIKVTGDTLIPRPETEELVDLIIRENKGFRGRIADIGTGSGCIAIALKKNLPDAAVCGIDISQQALKIAASNALLNNAGVTFIQGDILQYSKGSLAPAGIIVSNPPYVTESEKQFMKKNVLGFEPHTALFVADEDPLVYYRAIIMAAEDILIPGGKIYFEINESKGADMGRLMESAGYQEVTIIKDINGKNRFIKAGKNG